MTPKEAAAALVQAMPAGVAPSQLEEYGIEPVPQRAEALARAALSLNLFWMFAAIEAHIPHHYQAAVSELVLDAVKAGWGTAYQVGSTSWPSFLEAWREQTNQYERLVKEGISAMAIAGEVVDQLEEQRLIEESDRRNTLSLLVDAVSVETYGELLQGV
jgi:hypothetical protein